MRLFLSLSLAIIIFLCGCGDAEKPQDTTEKTPSDDVTKVKEKLLASLRKGAEFLKKSQAEDGHISQIPDASMTSVCALALARSPLRDEYRDVIDKAVDFLLKFLKADGSINDGQGYIVYKTSVVLSLLCSLGKERMKKFKEQIAAMMNYLLSAQYWDEKAKEDVRNGGWGYEAAKKRPPDLSNTIFALEALKDAGVPKDHKVWKRVQVFLRRCQGNQEVNDAKVDGWKPTNDGGFIYRPGDTRSSVKRKNPDGTVSYPSYGSMTYAGLLSMIYAAVSKTDTRVQSAWGWIKRNYTLDVNPGMSEKYDELAKQGLFYYYSILAKALFHYGERYLVDVDGNRHDWAVELTEKLVSMQREDGSWLNEADRWFEKVPELVTAYSIIALSYAHKALDELK